jgi:glutamate formiminotransferase/formiminotetrahydrofolate cyclodeaminase
VSTGYNCRVPQQIQKKDQTLMSMPIVECIPNFSEARRPEVVEQIMGAIQSAGEVTLLDRSSDVDHNRTVLTFAGPPAAVEEAAFRAIRTASELIDLDAHTGEHPRIGATDVCPFVPLSGITIDECVSMAKRLGERVGRELDIPVYLYEAAATRPERVNLENIRRGQYEALKAEIETDPARQPDFGPARLGKAGATVIGARNPLIAFNVYLTTDDVDIAKKIARAVRQSSGGFRFLKALGLLVEGRAQVSMNLTNFRETPIARVVETIRREAGRYGVAIHHTELVGLIPQDALTDAAVWYTQLDKFTVDQVLERKLTSGGGPTRQPPVSRLVYEEKAGRAAPDFLDELAAPTPTPGGGSAAAYAAAMGAGLVTMVAGLSVGKKKFAEVEAEMHAIHHQAEALRTELTQCVDDDSAAFEAVMGAFRLPKDTSELEKVRSAAIEMALLNAAHVPLKVAGSALRVMELAARCAEAGNHNAISDAASAGILARAGLLAAGYNVRINAHALADKEAGAPLVFQMAALEERAAELDAHIRDVLDERGGLAA